MEGYWKSPLGWLRVVSNGNAVTHLEFVDAKGKDSRDDIIEQCIGELEAYFAGELEHFSVPIDPAGTAFQKHVWEGLLKIPYGEVVSYGSLAEMVGHPGAARACGSANGRNPITVIIPCHRVVASNGLGGYSGGLHVKKGLLAVEGIDWKQIGRKH